MRRRILFHLIWKATRVGTEVVDVGLRGQQDGEDLVAAVVPAPPPRRGLDGVLISSRGPIPARVKSAAS